MAEKKSQEDFERVTSTCLALVLRHFHNDHPGKQQTSRSGTKDYPRQPQNSSIPTILQAIGETEDPFLLFLWVI
jgi:hypothetical protein